MLLLVIQIVFIRFMGQLSSIITWNEDIGRVKILEYVLAVLFIF